MRDLELIIIRLIVLKNWKNILPVWPSLSIIGALTRPHLCGESDCIRKSLMDTFTMF